MRLSFWVQMVAAIVIGIVALFHASGEPSTGGTIALLIFFAAVGYGWFSIKKEFDRIDRSRDRGA